MPGSRAVPLRSGVFASRYPAVPSEPNEHPRDGTGSEASRAAVPDTASDGSACNVNGSWYPARLR